MRRLLLALCGARRSANCGGARLVGRARYDGGEDAIGAFRRIELDRRGIAAYVAVLEPSQPGEAPFVEVGTTVDEVQARDAA